MEQMMLDARSALIEARRDVAREMALPGADVKLLARHLIDLQTALGSMDLAIRHEKELAAHAHGAWDSYQGGQ